MTPATVKNRFQHCFILLIVAISFMISISGLSFVVAQTTESETAYDLSETARRDRRYGIVEGKGGEGFRIPSQRPLVTAPVPPVPVPPPPTNPAPVSTPAPAVPSLPPTTAVRGSGSNIGSVTLLFNPLCLRVKEGTEFAQDIIINNPRGTGYDSAEFMIKYNPEYLSVVSFPYGAQPKTIESRIVPQKYPSAKIVANEVDEGKGIIRFKIVNPTGNFYHSGSIATIHWLAKKKTFGTKICYEFVSEKDQIGTAITQQTRDVLGAPGDPTDGVVSAIISID
ncbi:MAG: hypothetical protein N3A72_03565 [bacterium]|nr:hypothetical protein [bacterium]